MNCYLIKLFLVMSLVTDGNLFRARRRAKKRNSVLSSCDQFPCDAQGTECTMVEGGPRCVCSSTCRQSTNPSSFVCGSDGKVYPNRCLMDRAACLIGHVITAVQCSTANEAVDPHLIVETPRRHTVRQGASLTVHCSTSAAPLTQYYWIKKGSEGYLTSGSLPGVTINGLSLTINSSSPSHKGVYECLALYNAGSKTIKHQVIVEENKCLVLAREQAKACTGRSRSRFWTYDPSNRHQCFRVQSRGCSAVTNRFKTREECESTCADPCKLLPRRGSCRNYTPRLYFDQRTQDCKIFAYGGCNGNANNFHNYQACRRKCVEKLEEPRLSCPTCPINSGASFCNDDFAVVGILTDMQIDDVQWPYVTMRVTRVHKDTGETMNDVNTSSGGVEREFEVEIEKKCPCPDLGGLLRNRTLGSSEAEVILTGKYVYGIPTITQGSFGVLATQTNKGRMRSNVRSDLCTILKQVRNLQRARS